MLYLCGIIFPITIKCDDNYGAFYIGRIHHGINFDFDIQFTVLTVAGRADFYLYR